MSYFRVIPRDLFNEANLLKCYGRIYINLETAELPHVEFIHDGEAFQVEQDASDGSLFISNVQLLVNGQPQNLRRPLNSRASWPLELVDDEQGNIPVFNADGTFTEEMLAYLKQAMN